MKKKLFGNNVEISCNYCEHSLVQVGGNICKLNRSIKKAKCRKFKYNPTMRTPLVSMSIHNFSKEDFSI